MSLKNEGSYSIENEDGESNKIYFSFPYQLAPSIVEISFRFHVCLTKIRSVMSGQEGFKTITVSPSKEGERCRSLLKGNSKGMLSLVIDKILKNVLKKKNLRFLSPAGSFWSISSCVRTLMLETVNCLIYQE